jgi:hypothetical protein
LKASAQPINAPCHYKVKFPARGCPAEGIERGPRVSALCSADTMIAIGFREFIVRMTAAGLCDGDSCDFPLTQNEVGDALGLSTVHINRTVKKLHRDGLITVHAHLLTINNWTGLKEAADFDATYLELVRPTVLRQQ